MIGFGDARRGEPTNRARHILNGPMGKRFINGPKTIPREIAASPVTVARLYALNVGDI